MHIHEEKDRFLDMLQNVMKEKKEQPVKGWYHTAFARCSFLDFAITGLFILTVIGWIVLGLLLRGNDNCLICKLVTEEMILQNGSESETIPLYARGAVLMDADSGRVLFQKNGYEAMPMASTTKIMTCLLALENCNLEESVQISKEAAAQPPVKANLRQGETYRLGDLLLIMMLESYNDAAYAVAEHVGGNIDNFRDMMNEKAKMIGMEDTYFITPNGLDAKDEKGIHSSSAYDMALLGRYAILNDNFLQIIAERNAVISDLEGKRTITAVNRDAFLEQMEGSIGIKTGFTNGAGYCFVGAIRQNDKCLISVVLGSGWPPSKQYKWKDTRSLMVNGLENYDYTTFAYQLHPKCCLAERTSGNSTDLDIICEIEGTDVTKSYLISSNDEVIEKCVFVSNTGQNIKKGEILGYRMLYINGCLAERNELRAAKEINQPSQADNIIKIYQMFLLSTG